jgi:hypothetical protein
VNAESRKARHSWALVWFFTTGFFGVVEAVFVSCGESFICVGSVRSGSFIGTQSPLSRFPYRDSVLFSIEKKRKRNPVQDTFGLEDNE